MNTPQEQKIIDDFFLLFYNKGHTWVNPWMGVIINKSPLDLWIYQEIIYKTSPDVLIETGTHKGGSALYFASLFDLLGKGKVVTVDMLNNADPLAKKHPRITFLQGSSTDPKVFEQVKSLIKDTDSVMVSLDSTHSKSHVLNEIKLYKDIVTMGNYMVVEDGCIRHPVLPHYSNGPYEAIEEFMATDNNFTIDKSCEKFLMTFNPNGYLRRTR